MMPLSINFSTSFTYRVDINEKLSILPHTTDFPDYNPHITIAYVKKGKGKKYVVDNYNATLSSKKVMYSADEKTMFKLEE
jgi:2'-5' RNA ligase